MDFLLKTIDAGITVGSSTLVALCFGATPVGAIFGASYFAISTLGEVCLQAYKGKELSFYHYLLMRGVALIPAIGITVGACFLFGLAFSPAVLIVMSIVAFTAYSIFAIRECCQVCCIGSYEVAKERRWPVIKVEK